MTKLTYRDLLEKALDAKDPDVVSPVAKTLGLKRKEAADEMGELSIDDHLGLIDAVDRHDDGYIIATVKDGKKSPTGKLAEAPYRPGQFKPGQITAAMNGNKTDELSDELSDEEMADLTDDDVAARDQPDMKSMDKQPGAKKTPTGTVGTISERKNTMKNKLDERVLGMTALTGLQRMLELAGIGKDKEEKAPEEVEDKTEEVEDTVEQPETQPEEKPEEGKPAGIEVCDIQTGQVAMVGPTPEAAPQAACDPRTEIMTALDTITRMLPELKVKDYKDVSARLTEITSSVFESQMNRRRKI